MTAKIKNESHTYAISALAGFQHDECPYSCSGPWQKFAIRLRKWETETSDRERKNVAIKIILNNKQFSFRFYFCQLCVVLHTEYTHINISMLFQKSLDCFDKRKWNRGPVFDSIVFFFALSALKWIAKTKREMSIKARICGTNIHLVSKLLIDVLFDDWRKGTRNLFYIFRFFFFTSTKKYSSKKYCPTFFFHVSISDECAEFHPRKIPISFNAV